jgi:hypothetical protein
MTGLRICIVALSLIPSVALAQEPTRLDVGMGLDAGYEADAVGMGLGVRVAINGRAFRHVNPLVEVGLSSRRITVTNTGGPAGPGTQGVRRQTALAGVRIAPPRDTGPYANLLVGMRRQYVGANDCCSSGTYSTLSRQFRSTTLVFQPAGGMQFAISPAAAIRAEAGLSIGRNKLTEQLGNVEPASLFAWRLSAVLVLLTGRP